MKVLIETHLIVEGSRSIRRASFHVNDREFKNDANFAVACVAYDWIKKQWKEYGCRDMIIEKVTWNEENDITEIVQEIEPIVPDDLPF